MLIGVTPTQMFHAYGQTSRQIEEIGQRRITEGIDGTRGYLRSNLKGVENYSTKE